MVKVLMDEDMLVDMLVDRVRFWTTDATELELFKAMYTNYAEGGCFESVELDVPVIVDNDYVNWCKVIYKGDEDFERILDLYNNGEYDISCEHIQGFSFIEAVTDDAMLLR